MNRIIIRGARQHNLKNIDLTLPRNRLIVVTGVSGSGKSSLAFDTLYAEGQRRYVESLSTYARQFLTRLDPPEVDEVRGLSPAIAIEQKGLPRNPRSTVGTLTEIHDHLRVLFARLGTVYCPRCYKPVQAHTISQMVEETLSWPEGARVMILAPLGTLEREALPQVFKKLRREGFVRVRMDGEVVEVDPPPRPARRRSHRVEVVVDRLVVRRDQAARLFGSLELAAATGNQTVVVARVGGEERLFTTTFRCGSCGKSMAEPSPSLFSFHHPAGTCTECKGLGYVDSGSSKARDHDADEGDQPPADQAVCPRCNGTRLNAEARSVRFGGLSIDEVSRLAVPKVKEWVSGLRLAPAEQVIADRPLRAVSERLESLVALGLDYLSLDRSAPTLSGGEAQRIRLASQIGSPLSGVLYVLDEPSIGLHARDHGRLLDVLKRLRDAGNTIVVVEHDPQTILSADHVVDLGPGAGALGGELVFAGPATELLDHPASLTGRYLAGAEAIPVPRRRTPFHDGALTLEGARGNNLKGIRASFPLGCFTCVTGVSGSGKSTLVLDTLYRALAQQLHRSRQPAAPYDRIEISRNIGRVLHIDQAPIGRTPRSTPATYTGVFGLIRNLFSRLPEARARGYGSDRFSFNAKGGRCEACKGEGLRRIEMLFLPDVYVTCPACRGDRYHHETLSVRFKGHSIADVLRMTAHQAASLFEHLPAIRHKLDILQEVGLGYVTLGQPATTLSGGEAQRLKLGRELGRRVKGHALYILDEPTTGLHLDDVRRLIAILQRLADVGHTIIVIEHHLDVIKSADYVIDLGPEGGDQGGEVVAAGTPEELARADQSITGRWLRPLL